MTTQAGEETGMEISNKTQRDPVFSHTGRRRGARTLKDLICSI